MKNKNNVLIIVCILVVVAGFMVMFKPSITLPSISLKSENVMPEANSFTDDINANCVVEQTFTNKNDSIEKIAIVFHKLLSFEKEDNVLIVVSLKDGERVLTEKTVNVSEIEEQHRLFVNLDQKYTGMKNKNLTLTIKAGVQNTGLTVMMQTNNKDSFKFGGNKVNGTLCFVVE